MKLVNHIVFAIAALAAGTSASSVVVTDKQAHKKSASSVVVTDKQTHKNGFYRALEGYGVTPSRHLFSMESGFAHLNLFHYLTSKSAYSPTTEFCMGIRDAFNKGLRFPGKKFFILENNLRESLKVYGKDDDRDLELVEDVLKEPADFSGSGCCGQGSCFLNAESHQCKDIEWAMGFVNHPFVLNDMRAKQFLPIQMDQYLNSSAMKKSPSPAYNFDFQFGPSAEAYNFVFGFGPSAEGYSITRTEKNSSERNLKKFEDFFFRRDGVFQKMLRDCMPRFINVRFAYDSKGVGPKKDIGNGVDHAEFGSRPFHSFILVSNGEGNVVLQQQSLNHYSLKFWNGKEDAACSHFGFDAFLAEADPFWKKKLSQNGDLIDEKMVLSGAEQDIKEIKSNFKECQLYPDYVNQLIQDHHPDDPKTFEKCRNRFGANKIFRIGDESDELGTLFTEVVHSVAKTMHSRGKAQPRDIKNYGKVFGGTKKARAITFDGFARMPKSAIEFQAVEVPWAKKQQTSKQITSAASAKSVAAASALEKSNSGFRRGFLN